MNLFGTIFWNFYATCYDTIAYLHPYQDMLDEVICAAGPADGCMIFDAGCGTGNLEQLLLKASLGVRVEAIDFSPAMIARAQSKVGVAEVRFREANLDEPLPFQSQLFDVVISINCLYAVPRPEVTLAEIRRVLKPGGRLVVAELRADANMWIIFAQHLRAGLQTGGSGAAAVLAGTLLRLPRWLLFGALNMIIYSRARKGGYTFRTAEEWKDLLFGLQFSGVAVEPVYAGQANLISAVTTQS